MHKELKLESVFLKMDHPAVPKIRSLDFPSFFKVYWSATDSYENDDNAAEQSPQRAKAGARETPIFQIWVRWCLEQSHEKFVSIYF